MIWHIAGHPLMSAKARATIEDAALAGDQVAISSISLVEIVYLVEKRRIDPATLGLVTGLLDLDDVFVEIPVDRAVVLEMRAIDRVQVPDMPDRIIAATALTLGVPLLSRDGKIRASNVPTIW